MTVTKGRGNKIGLFMNNKSLCGYFSEWGSTYIYMSTHVTVTHRSKLAPSRVLEPCWAVSAGTTPGWHCPHSLSGSCLCISRGVLFLLSAHEITTWWQRQVSKPTLLPACLSHFLHQAVAMLPNPRTVCRAWVKWKWPEQSCRVWFPFLLLLSAINFMDSWLMQGLLPAGFRLTKIWSVHLLLFSFCPKVSLSWYEDLKAWEIFSPPQFVQWFCILTA